MYLARNKEDGEDLFQDTFIELQKYHLRLIKLKIQKVIFYLLQLIYGKIRFKKEIGEIRIVGVKDLNEANINLIEDGNMNTEEIVISKIRNTYVLDIINRLDDKYRVTIILYYLEDKK